MRTERVQALGRALAWSSPTLLLAGGAAALTIPADAGESGWFAALVLTLFYGAVATGLAGAAASVVAARRMRGRSRVAAVRTSLLAALIPVLFALVWLADATSGDDSGWWGS